MITERTFKKATSLLVVATLTTSLITTPAFADSEAQEKAAAQSWSSWAYDYAVWSAKGTHEFVKKHSGKISTASFALNVADNFLGFASTHPAISIAMTALKLAPLAAAIDVTPTSQNVGYLEHGPSVQVGALTVSDVTGGNTVRVDMTLNDPSLGNVFSNVSSPIVQDLGSGLWRLEGTTTQINNVLADFHFLPVYEADSDSFIGFNIYEMNGATPVGFVYSQANLDVTPVNDPPVISGSPTLDISGDTPTSTVPATTFDGITDADGPDPITITPTCEHASFSPSSFTQVQAQASQVSSTYTGDGQQVPTCTFQATDAGSASSNGTLSINFTPKTVVPSPGPSTSTPGDVAFYDTAAFRLGGTALGFVGGVWGIHKGMDKLRSESSRLANLVRGQLKLNIPVFDGKKICGLRVLGSNYGEAYAKTMNTLSTKLEAEGILTTADHLKELSTFLAKAMEKQTGIFKKSAWYVPYYSRYLDLEKLDDDLLVAIALKTKELIQADSEASKRLLKQDSSSDPETGSSSSFDEGKADA